MEKRIKTVLSGCLSLTLAAALCAGLPVCSRLSVRASEAPSHYRSVLAAYSEAGIYPAINGTGKISAASYSSLEGVAPGAGARDGSVFWSEDTSCLSWSVEVPDDGLYCIGVSYSPAGGSVLSPSRKLLVNGSQPFEEASKLLFPRHWADESEPVRNSLGDDVCPVQGELTGWFETYLCDSQGKSPEPLVFALEKGTNTITLEYIGEPMELEWLELSAPRTIPSYSEVSAEYTGENAASSVRIEAESRDSIVYKSDSSILSQANSDPSVTPYEVTHIRLNTVGGYSWSEGHGEICWRLSVPETGLYKLRLRVLQNWNSGLSSYRSIRVNGELPFSEAGCITFPYSTVWQDCVPQTDSGEPYLFSLEKGENLISMQVELGASGELSEQLSDAAGELSDIIFDITRITGYTPDPNYNYSLETEIPGLCDRLAAVRDVITVCRGRVNELSGKNSTMEGNLKSAESDLNALIERPTFLSTRLSDLNTMLTNLSDWAATLKTSPLAVDYIELLPPDTQVISHNSSWTERLWVTLRNFAASFTKDYNAIGGTKQTGDPLDIWISRGKEWARIIEERAAADFTPETGQSVRLHILPSGSISSSVNPLLLALSSGVTPDAVMGLAYDLPVEYALRGMVQDLKSFSDFESVSGRFLEQSLVPFTFENHVYALPESVSFRVMYYRTDIFKRLGLTVPETWDEVYDNLLPVLNQNNMKLYVPQILDMFLYQRGGNYYTEDGRASALTDSAAYQAFSELCRLYTDNGVPVSANFYNRFRTGEIPVGIENASQYLMFSYAAPEIAGSWAIAPVPGHRNADGTINRTNSGTAVDGCLILKNAVHKDGAWEFLKWWTRADTQTTFSKQVEGRIGAKARWLSANNEAFNSLPWSKSDRAAIKSAWDNLKETPVVLGSYFTNRHLVNAINRTVIQGMSARDSLEEAVEQIDIELARRQAGYYRRNGKAGGGE